MEEILHHIGFPQPGKQWDKFIYQLAQGFFHQQCLNYRLQTRSVCVCSTETLPFMVFAFQAMEASVLDCSWGKKINEGLL